MHWQPKDVVATIAVTGSLFLMAMGRNYTITFIFAALIAGYVGIDVIITRRKR